MVLSRCWSWKLVVLKSASTVNSNRFWWHYQCLIIKKLNTLDTRNVLVVKPDMKVFVQLLFLRNSVTLPATVAYCISFECKQIIGIPWSLQLIVNTTAVTYCVHFYLKVNTSFGGVMCSLQLNLNMNRGSTAAESKCRAEAYCVHLFKTKHKLSRGILLSFSLNVNRNSAVVYSLLKWK